MGLKTFWRDHRLLIVMIPSLALIHLGWYSIQGHPAFQPKREEIVPEPGIVTYVLEQEKRAKGK